MERRLVLCQSENSAVKEAAVAKLADACGPLAEALPGEEAIRLLRKLMRLHFDGSVVADACDLWAQLKWIRNRYSDNREKGPEKPKELWNAIISENRRLDRAASQRFISRPA